MNSRVLKAPRQERSRFSLMLLVFGMLFAAGAATPSHAQALGWEGETGVFVTPLAYTASAENEKLHPVVAYHYLNAGPVIGDFHEISVEVGVGKRLEFGYTHEFHTFGDNADLSPLWQNGFDIFNGKVILVPENYGKQKWVPGISPVAVSLPESSKCTRLVGEHQVAGSLGVKLFAERRSQSSCTEQAPAAV